MSVAHTAETLRNYISWDDEGEAADRYWVGPTPRLSTLDGDASYARKLHDIPGGRVISPTATLAPFNLDSLTSVSAQVRVNGGEAGIVLFVADSTGSNPISVSFDDLTIDTWHVITVSRDDIYDESSWPWLKLAAAAGEAMVGAWGAIGNSSGFDVSWLEVKARPIATRVCPRADGLGMGAPRLMDGRSPYRSERVFGMI